MENETTVTQETYSIVNLPSGNIRVEYSIDLGSLLISLLLVALLVLHSFTFIARELKERGKNV